MESIVGSEQVELDTTCSDTGSVSDGPVCEEVSSFDGMRRLREEEEEHVLLKHRFYMCIGSLAQHCSVAAIHRNGHSGATGRARLGAFQLHLKAMTEKRGGNPIVRQGWFGTSKDGVRRIVKDGFGVCGVPEDGGLFGFGLCLSSEGSALDSVLLSPVDEDGLRHLVLCRVILGNVEEVPPGSRKFQPSSENFDAGVDNLLKPTKYIIWYPNVNTHIVPLYVLSIKLDFVPIGLQKESVKKPSSPWIPFPALLSALSESLPPSTMCLIRRLHSQFLERKISRQKLVLRVRKLTGDELLISAIKSFQDKVLQAKLGSLLARDNLVITRDIEWANIMLAFEQESRYIILDPCCPQTPVGSIREQSNVIFRQLLRARRPFVAHITDAMGSEIFMARRPFWWINSIIYVEVDGKEVGLVHRRWHLWRRIYDLYLGNRQFAVVENPGFWNWTFTLKDDNDNVLAQIDRNWRGVGLEMFTDAGKYVIRFGDASSLAGPTSELPELKVARPLTLPERALTVALAVSLDSDYFSMRGRWGFPLLIAAE